MLLSLVVASASTQQEPIQAESRLDGNEVHLSMVCSAPERVAQRLQADSVRWTLHMPERQISWTVELNTSFAQRSLTLTSPFPEGVVSAIAEGLDVPLPEHLGSFSPRIEGVVTYSSIPGEGMELHLPAMFLDPSRASGDIILQADDFNPPPTHLVDGQYDDIRAATGEQYISAEQAEAYRQTGALPSSSD